MKRWKMKEGKNEEWINKKDMKECTEDGRGEYSRKERTV